MLEIRPSCERCDRNIDPGSTDVFICSYECTWCADCTELAFQGICPNCGGELVRRPIRPAAQLADYPPSTARVYNPDLLQSGP